MIMTMIMIGEDCCRTTIVASFRPVSTCYFSNSLLPSFSWKHLVLTTHVTTTFGVHHRDNRFFITLRLFLLEGGGWRWEWNEGIYMYIFLKPWTSTMDLGEAEPI